MTADVLIVSAVALSFASAARSTWSPCGLSMLATITPLAEGGRGHRYRWAAAWFVAGGLAGGATLGVIDGGLAALFRSLAPSWSVLHGVALAATVVTLVAELGLWGFRIPVHHRQVNERWLDQFRPWVYAGGFGWQVGTGLATYIMTPALYLMILMAALTTTPWVALSVVTSFGLIRGLAVLLGRHIDDVQSLTVFHQRFQNAEPRVWRALVGVECAVVVVCAWAVSPWMTLGLIILAVPVVVGCRLPLPSRTVDLDSERRQPRRVMSAVKMYR